MFVNVSCLAERFAAAALAVVRQVQFSAREFKKVILNWFVILAMLFVCLCSLAEYFALHICNAQSIMYLLACQICCCGHLESVLYSVDVVRFSKLMCHSRRTCANIARNTMLLLVLVVVQG